MNINSKPIKIIPSQTQPRIGWSEKQVRKAVVNFADDYLDIVQSQVESAESKYINVLNTYTQTLKRHFPYIEVEIKKLPLKLKFKGFKAALITDYEKNKLNLNFNFKHLKKANIKNTEQMQETINACIHETFHLIEKAHKPEIAKIEKEEFNKKIFRPRKIKQTLAEIYYKLTQERFKDPEKFEKDILKRSKKCMKTNKCDKNDLLKLLSIEKNRIRTERNAFNLGYLYSELYFAQNTHSRNELLTKGMKRKVLDNNFYNAQKTLRKLTAKAHQADSLKQIFKTI